MKTIVRIISLFALTIIFCLHNSNFIRANAEEIMFKDIDVDAYFYEPVQQLAGKGIIKGYQDGTFKPYQPVTRGQAALMLVQTLQLDTSTVTNPQFKDISTEHPYYKQIATLVNKGIISGFEDNTFRPNEQLTRAHMAGILTKAYEFELNEEVHLPFTDVSENAWYKNAIQTLLNLKITNGVTPTTFEPNSPVTRGQLATFIYKSDLASMSVEIIAGNGIYENVDGKALEASFRFPTNLAILSNGSMLISDQENHSIRQLKDGNVLTYAGMPLLTDEFGNPEGALHDAQKDSAMFSSPSGIDVDSSGNIYIADTENHVIRKILTNGNVITLAGDSLPGLIDDKAENARFYYPQDIAAAKDGTIYVADTLNHVIRKIDNEGNVTTLNATSMRPVEVVAGVIESAGEFKDGKLSEAKFNEPTSLVIDSKGNLYVSDTGNQAIRYIDFTNNVVTTVAGKVTLGNKLYADPGYQDGAALEAKFASPRGLALTNEGGLLIADSANHTIRYLLDGKVTTIIEGLRFPTDVGNTSDGSIVVVDSYNNQIIKINKKY